MLRLASVQVVALTAAAVTFLLTTSWDRWNPGSLVAIALLSIVSDLTSVEAEVGHFRVSGTALGLVPAAVLLGGGPAALIGMLTVAVGWFRWREPPIGLGANIVTYAWFPLITGIFFHASTHSLHVGSNSAYYYCLVFLTAVVGVLVSFFSLAAQRWMFDGSSLLRKALDSLMPVLSAELFSAVLITLAVFFVVNTGTVGIVALAIILAIFQYLVGELLKSRQRAEELRRKATTDELTGLANRERFSSVLEERIGSASIIRESFAVMLIDLDRFKEINDTLGHHYGDLLLRDLGPRLAACLGAGGLVARLGGDEFAVLPGPATADPRSPEETAAELLAAVRQPIVVDELTLDIGASIGISRFPADGENVHDLLRRADVAMYSAKDDHAGYRLYESRLDRYSLRRLSVLGDFRRGLESDEFVLHFQPLVDLAASQVRGAEGLVRWQHPELGLLPPGDFVPIAEQSGLIGPLTRYVLERAIFECTRWRADGRDLAVSVNLSVRDLLDRELPAQVASVLAAYRLPAENLHLEITESMIMSDPERALATVRRLRDLGVHISVDDFGTGYSSLSNLKQLPINELKIDRSFVSSMIHEESDLIIVRSTINLGHDLGLNVVAEGVEDEMTLNRLRLLGCDLAQGYHFGRPLPAEEFIESVNEIDGQAARAASAVSV